MNIFEHTLENFLVAQVLKVSQDDIKQLKIAQFLTESIPIDAWEKFLKNRYFLLKNRSYDGFDSKSKPSKVFVFWLLPLHESNLLRVMISWE